MLQPIIQIKNYKKAYKKKDFVVSGVSFDIYEGKFHAFIGSNGSGKTTLIKSIISAYTQFDGQILINNISNYKKEAKQYLGYTPENTIFSPNWTVKQFLFAIGLASNLSTKKINEQINHYTSLFKIKDLLNKNPNELSSGQKKKIMLIQALINDPKVIVLDEPTTNLDPIARNELLELLNLLVMEKKITVFISTHDLKEVDEFANYVTVLEKGELLYSGEKNNTSLTDLYFQLIRNKQVRYEA